MSVADIAYAGVLGEPLFKVIGLAAALSLAAAAAVQVLNRRGAGLPPKAHSRLAWSGLALVLLHVSLAVLS